MTTKITGIVRDLEGRPLSNSMMRFERRSGVRGQDGATVVPRVVNAKTDSGGNISVELYPGEYRAQADRGSGALTFSVGVPEDVGKVDLTDLIDQLPEITPTVALVTRQARDEAVGSAQDAANSETAAADSAVNAANSETNAANSEQAAAGSEANAGQSAQDAQDAADSIPTVPFGLEDGGTGADTAEGARGNLGLGTAATENDDRYAHRANNLSDIADAPTARGNLGLGTAAEADIVGTVSQSGGDPTGAVIERGSNSNGEYVRYADGTQECWLRRLMAEGTGASMNRTWNFPADFSGTSQLSVSANYRGPNDGTNPNSFATDASLGATQIGNIGLGNFTTSSVRLAVIKQATEPNFEEGDKMYMTLQAKGRWF